MTLSLVPFLCVGMIFAIFHWAGTSFLSYINLNSADSGFVNVSAPSFKILRGILSIPSQFFIFI